MRVLLPVPADRRPARFTLLAGGLVAYGVSVGLMLQAGLGLMPWSVLDQGLSETFGLEVGTWSIIMGVVVLLLWIPLRRRPGIGTISNVLLVGLTINATLAVLPEAHTLAVQVPLLLAGVVLNGIATGAYIGAGLGPGPRDGLTTGLAERGLSVRVVRTVIEVGVLAVGWLLGGDVGVGTVLYALAIGPIMHRTVPALRLRSRPAVASAPATA
ncbi:hypothetical protein [Modestobacter sp. NPDC049651]|uniref:membrane protein YczE n=1 Tax=unclassified Modestobacter TaxID=2643866 RepID=UPI0033CD867E